MTITLTNDQYRSLVKLVLLGGWMANAFKDEMLPGSDDAEQTLLSRAPAFGSDDVVVYDVKRKKWGPNREFGEELNKLIDDYNIDTMYDELAHGLAHRDLIAKLGEERAQAMSDEEFSEAERPIMGQYEDEFDEYGIERLGIDAVAGAGGAPG